MRNSVLSRALVGLIAGEPMSGYGLARLFERTLARGEQLHVDTGCLAAYTSDVDFDLVRAGGIKSMIFGGEGLFFARLTGPGKVWIQSLPFSRLAGRMLAAARCQPLPP